MGKRLRKPKARPGELLIRFGKVDGEVDLFYCHGGQGATKRDARLLSHFFEVVTWPDGMNLRKELEYRGYDISTLLFSVQQKQPNAKVSRAHE